MSQTRPPSAVTAPFWLLATAILVSLSWALLESADLLPQAARRPIAIAFPCFVVLILLLGIALLVTSYRRRASLEPWLWRWLMFTGAAGTAAGAGIVVHNVTHVLVDRAGAETLLGQGLNGLAVFTFFVGILSPFVALVGVVGTAIRLRARSST